MAMEFLGKEGYKVFNLGGIIQASGMCARALLLLSLSLSVPRPPMHKTRCLCACVSLSLWVGG